MWEGDEGRGMTLTTEITFADLITAREDELADLREAYEEFLAYGEDEHGDGQESWPAELVQQVAMLNETAKTIQQRIHVLERYREQYDDDTFEIAMLTGQELSDIETELRGEAATRDVGVDVLQAERKQKVVDAATVDAPEDVPRVDGTPAPSECGNPLAFALYEAVERFNGSGDMDFRAPGFESEADSVASNLSPDQITTATSATDSGPDDASTPGPGNDS